MDRWIRVFFLLCMGLSTSGVWAANSETQPTAPSGGVVGNGTSGSCDEAALEAALVGGGMVIFACGGLKTITLTSAKSITQPTTIDGGGLVTLNGGETTRLFNVEATGILALENITITRGFGGSEDGGAIANHGTLRVEHAAFTDNQTDSDHQGGAIFSDGPTHISHSLFEGNVGGDGGALFASSATAQVYLTETTFLDNYAVNTTTGYGGAMLVGEDAYLSFHAGIVEGNHAQYGGALYLSPGGQADLSGVFYYVPCPPSAAVATPNSPAACLTGMPANSNPGQLLIIRNEASQDGGAIYNDEGTLSLRGVQLTANEADPTNVANGGAIFNQGVLTATQTLFSLNQARQGGGLATQGDSFDQRAFLFDVYFTFNQAELGGGLFATSSDTFVGLFDSYIYYNSADAGGGIYRYNAALLVQRSAFELNLAVVGGAMFTAVQPITNTSGDGVYVRDTTFSRNEATMGSAVYNADLLEFRGVTVYDNADGVYSQNTGDWRLQSSVLDNTGDSCPGAAPLDEGDNFVTDLSCALGPNSQQGAALDPMLGPSDHGPLGRTVFYVPLPGSPLINQGSSCSELDQRGAKRPDICDIGAVEFGGMLPALWLPLLLR